MRVENFPIKLPAVFASSGEADTFVLGERFSSMLEKGSIVALNGPLGAGKTCFTKGIAKGLGIAEEITSPTYTIISEYEGFLPEIVAVPVYHIDAYRLKGGDDFLAIGGEEIIFGNGISIIEWSSHISSSIPEDAFHVDIEILRDNERRVRIYRDVSPPAETEKK